MTYRQACSIALRKYRAALKAGERGDWKRADALTNTRSDVCAFCITKVERGDRCHQCPVDALCLRHPQHYANWVLYEDTPPTKALTLYRVIIRRLEKLQAKYRAEKGRTS